MQPNARARIEPSALKISTQESPHTHMSAVVASTASADESLLAALAASSFDISHTSFEGSLRSLLSTATLDLAAAGQPTQSPPYWLMCTRKIKAAFERMASDAPLKAMFASFFAANKASLASPVVGEDGRIDDTLLRSTALFPSPPLPATGKPPSNINKGPVVYFSMTDSKLSSVCLPIGEIYSAALARHRSRAAAGDANENDLLLPTTVLLDFYATVYHSLPQADFDVGLETNVIELCSAAETVAPGRGPGAAAAAAALETAPNSSSSSLLDIVGGLLGALGGGADACNTIDGVKRVLQTVAETVSATAPTAGGDANDPAALVARIGTLLSSPDLQQQIASTTASASAAYNGIVSRAAPGGATTTANAVVDVVE